jgi:hypothetical protein
MVGLAFRCVAVVALRGWGYRIRNVQAFSGRAAVLAGGLRPANTPQPLGQLRSIKGIAINETVDNPVPRYNEKALAREVFASKYFYRGDQEAADYSSTARELFFNQYGIVTVRDMVDKLKSSQVRTELRFVIHAKDELLAFCKNPKTTEQELHDAEIVALNSADEIKAIQARYIPMESMQRAIRWAMDIPEGCEKVNRVMKAVVVLGSSGSGKTFLAVMEGAGHLAAKQHPSGLCTTLYLKPALLDCFKESDTKSLPAGLTKWIRDELKKTYGTFGQLKMHVSVVLDDIGGLGYFMSGYNIEKILQELHTLAASARLVVSGMGIFPGYRIPTCRLKSWTVANVKRMLTLSPYNFKEAQSDLVVEAIQSQFMLGSLLTNARTCYCLLTSIDEAFAAVDMSGDKAEIWLSLINTSSAGLIACAVSKYMNMTDIGGLDPVMRRRVAACVFQVIDQSLPGLLVEPNFTGLGEDEKTVALGLIEQNLEIVAHKLQFSTGDTRSITISSAHVVVLYYMLGVRAELFPLWHNQEQLTARYAYRTQLLAFMKNRWANYSNCTDEYKRSALVAELDEYLANLRIVPLRKKIQEPAGKEMVDSFSLPRTLSNTVMLNAAKASFADVLSSKVLYRSVHCDAGIG